MNKRRHNTIRALRAAFTDVTAKIDSLHDERARISESLAKALCPVAVGERFKVEGQTKDAWGAVIPASAIYHADEIEPTAAIYGAHKLSWLLKARRVLKSGELSQRRYCFAKRHQPRKA